MTIQGVVAFILPLNQEGLEIADEAIEDWNNEHTGKEIQRLGYWRKKKLKEILERMEKRGKGG